MDKQIIDILNRKLPDWALKPHPTKKMLSVIHPMAVIDRLNEAFGVGEWKFTTEYTMCNTAIQKTQKGDRDVFMSAVKGTLIVEKHNIHIEQYGGSTNDDMGDALKGGATDALTKCASYLGVGASVYKGQGNVEPVKQVTVEEAMAALRDCKTFDELKATFMSLGDLKTDPEVIAMKDQLKEELVD